MAIITSFPGYEYINGKNMYRGVDLGKGGYVYSEPGMYENVALLDVASLHPHSIIAMNCFGDYTERFHDILNARIYIKHKDFDKARQMLGGALAPYLDDEAQADNLAQALKIAINSVYGLTSASFDNPFRDPRNDNNIVALRGALFMKTLQDEVMAKGYTVAHIKTDSIKIPNADRAIIDFCMNFANQYGYIFEHEATYSRMCLVNKSTYIARYATVEECDHLYGDGYSKTSKDTVKECKKHGGQWTATGAQFQESYVFKTLFSKEPIGFKDYCETKEVKGTLYLDMNEDLPEGEHCYRFVGRIGSFCPIISGAGGGELMREAEGKYSAATGTKGYRWMEGETVKALHKEDCIDISYFNKLVDEAVTDISKYGDFEWFVSDDRPLFDT